ncbi:MAG: protein kinase [Myxococcales bacterium]|nr:protein kinase [Myxococcales bacterium]
MSTPETFGPYTLLQELAQGGMAVTWLGRVSSDEAGRELVIKRILPEVAGDAEVRAFFEEEARTAMLLDHENLVRTWDYGQDHGEHYIAMEYIWGQDLRRIVERGQAVGQFIPQRLVVDIVARAARGLYVAHNAVDERGRPVGLVHRDVSPPNIMVGFDGKVKVVDFGIAKAESHYMKVRPGQLKGKFSYMSPEQVQGLEIDHRSDIFALGIVLYELTTRKRLFRADSDMATIRLVSEARFDAPHRVRADYPPRLEEIVMKALAREPRDRYQSAWDFAQALENFLKETRSEPTPAQLASYMKEIFADQIEDIEALIAPGYAGPTAPPRIPAKPRPVAAPASPASPTPSQRPRTLSGPVVSVTHVVGATDDPVLRSHKAANPIIWLSAIAAVIVVGLGIYTYVRQDGNALPTLMEFEAGPRREDMDVETPRRADPPPTVTARVESVPEGAWVVVNGVATRRRTPTDVELVQGATNTVFVYQRGYQPAYQNIEVGTDAPAPTSVALTAIEQPADWQPTPATDTEAGIDTWTPPMGTLRIESRNAGGDMPGAEVLVNGEPVPGTTPLEVQVPAGVDQHVTVRMADNRDSVLFTRVPANELRVHRVEMLTFNGDSDYAANLYINLSPASASLTLNGEPAPGGDVIRLEAPLHYVLRAEAEDYETWERAYSADVGAIYINTFLPPISFGPSQLSYTVEPAGTVVYVQPIRPPGSAYELGDDPIVAREMPAGEYELRFEFRNEDGRQRGRLPLTLQSGQHHTYLFTLAGTEVSITEQSMLPMEGAEAGSEGQ